MAGQNDKTPGVEPGTAATKWMCDETAETRRSQGKDAEKFARTF